MSKTTDAGVDLVFFACEGREHLLIATAGSLDSACGFRFDRRILAADGPVSSAAQEIARPDVLVQNVRRSGYVRSIFNALAQIESPYFLWVEEDWQFLQPVHVERMAVLLDANPEWAQVRLSRMSPPSTAARAPLAPGVYLAESGFSANPALNRTDVVRRAMDEFRTAPADAPRNFEEFLRGWCDARSLQCVVIDPGPSPAVSHQGYLESTARQWHTRLPQRGAEQVTARHLSAIGPLPPAWGRLPTFARFVLRAAGLATKLFRSDAAFETAVRFLSLPRSAHGGQ